MTFLLDFIFQSGDFYNQDSSSFWESLIGAFIGAATALLIFYLETWREKGNDKRQKQEHSKNNLQYFTSLLDAIIIFAEKQYPAYKEHSKSIKEHPLEFHMLHTIIAEDLNRMLNKLDQEKLFHSYINKFGNSKDRIKTFQKIFSRMDYIYKLYEQANKSQEKHFVDLTERLGKYKDLTEEQTLNYCSLIINNIKHTNANFEHDPFYNAINSAILNYYQTGPTPKTLDHMQTNFITPIKEQMVSNFRSVNEGMTIANNCRKATWLYNETIKKSEYIADDFDEYFKGLKTATNELKEFSKDLFSAKDSN